MFSTFFFFIIILCFQHYIDQDTQAVCIVSVTSVIQFSGQCVQSLCLFLPSAFSFSCSKADLVSNGNIFCSLSLQGIRFVVFVRNEMQEKNTPLLLTLPPHPQSSKWIPLKIGVFTGRRQYQELILLP